MRPLQVRGHFDHGLVGLHGNEGLVGDHVIALVDMPGDDLGLFEAFTEIGQVELAHERTPTSQPNRQTLRAAAAMRPTDGM